jgi:ABC-2 type transport system permease protein
MNSPARYLRLLGSFARYGLAREMAFRGNFIIKMLVELLWLAILLIFYRTVFTQTSHVADWTEAEYLFFLGCYFTLEAVMETFFLSNCSEFADLVRSGDLDFYLLQPIDEQFLITCRTIDWTTLPNLAIGVGIMITGLGLLGWTVSPVQVLLFVIMFVCGVALSYSFLLLLTSSAVWMVRNQSLFELWWLFTTLIRYPREIYLGTWFAPASWFLTYVIPVLLIINVPAHTMVKVLDPVLVGYMLAATLALVLISRRYFRYALQRYRSASS